MIYPEVEIARRCLHLYRWSRSDAQWAAHYVSLTGEWEWYFWA